MIGRWKSYTPTVRHCSLLLVCPPFLVWVCAPPAVADDSASIDGILRDTWQRHKIHAAPLCSDAEYLRRLSLDLAGRIPTTDELDLFVQSPDRAAKVDELLHSNEFPRFWAELWSSVLTDYHHSRFYPPNRLLLRQWLAAQFRNNRRFTNIAADLITASGTVDKNGAVSFLVRHADRYDAERVTVRISQAFLGIRLDCAVCHDHPFDRWTQEDFRSMKRFFEAVDFSGSRERLRVRDVVPRAASRKPRFLSGVTASTTQWREEFALYATNSQAFSRNFANRMWYLLMGRGIVDPPDDFSTQHPPAVPALLDYLSDVAHRNRCDLRAMIRLICTSDAYSRTSRRSQPDTKAQQVFAYRVLKPLTAEQLYDSIAVAYGTTPQVARGDFIKTFTVRTFGQDYTNSWTYRELDQHLLDKFSLDLPSARGTVSELFLRFLSRQASPRERQLCGGRSADEIAFALVHSNEFFWYH